MHTHICMCANEDSTWAALWLRTCVWLTAYVTFASSCFPVMHAKPVIRSPLYYRINCFSFSTCPLSLLVLLPFCVISSVRDYFLSSQLLAGKHLLGCLFPQESCQCITGLSHTSCNNTGHNVSELIQLLRPKLCPAARKYFELQWAFGPENHFKCNFPLTDNLPFRVSKWPLSLATVTSHPSLNKTLLFNSLSGLIQSP